MDKKTRLPLHALSAGETAIIEEVAGEPDFISRVTATGFTRNAKVTMLQNWKWEPVIEKRIKNHCPGRTAQYRKIIHF